MEIKYVPMPITIEQKREYNRQGFRVVDASFAPEGTVVESTKEAHNNGGGTKRRRRKSEE